MVASDKQRQIIHLHLIKKDEHHYFGSIRAMYETYSREQIGVASQTLYNSWKDEAYVTELAVIRKGRLIQKKHRNNPNEAAE